MIKNHVNMVTAGPLFSAYEAEQVPFCFMNMLWKFRQVVDKQKWLILHTFGLSEFSFYLEAQIKY
jgi:hypothetical protein